MAYSRSNWPSGPGSNPPVFAPVATGCCYQSTDANDALVAPEFGARTTDGFSVLR